MAIGVALGAVLVEFFELLVGRRRVLSRFLDLCSELVVCSLGRWRGRNNVTVVLPWVRRRGRGSEAGRCLVVAVALRVFPSEVA